MFLSSILIKKISWLSTDRYYRQVYMAICCLVKIEIIESGTCCANIDTLDDIIKENFHFVLVDTIVISPNRSQS